MYQQFQDKTVKMVLYFTKVLVNLHGRLKYVYIKKKRTQGFYINGGNILTHQFLKWIIFQELN